MADIFAEGLKAILPAANVEAFAKIVRGSEPFSLTLNPGQEVRVEVLSSLTGGRFLVRLAGALLDMNLPQGTRAGDTVQLTFVADRPRLTFSLAQSGNSSAPVTLSDTGRWLTSLTRTPPGNSPQPAPVSIAEARPLLTDPAGTSELAGRLRETLVKSGIFYESHVAEWARGKGNVAELLGEPQGKLSTAVALPADEPGKAASQLQNAQAHKASDLQKIPVGKGNPAPLQSEPQAKQALAGAPSEEASKAAYQQQAALAKEFADPQTVPIIRQQLETLLTGLFIWKGEAWPGQEMEWSVTEREAEQGEEEGKLWQTELRLDLPKLGKVQIALHIKDMELRVSARAANRETADVMGNSANDLREGLAGSGINLAGMVIAHEE